MLFINTRPTARAQPLTDALTQAKQQVFELPLLELRAMPFDATLEALYGRLSKASVLVVVSPTAVDVGIQYLSEMGIPLESLAHVNWIAVGRGTEKALSKYGIQSHVPEVETSEGMLTLPALAKIQSGDCVAFWRGEGGRQFMMQSLKDIQVEVLNFVLYTRFCPDQATLQKDACIAQMQQASAVVVLISSEASWLNWLKLMQDMPKWIKVAQYWVLGPRLASVLGEYCQRNHMTFEVCMLQDLNTETVLAQMTVERKQ